jgi:hypothetical protein
MVAIWLGSANVDLKAFSDDFYHRICAGWCNERGRCATCGEPCAGVVDGVPGGWGARRLPVRLRV